MTAVNKVAGDALTYVFTFLSGDRGSSLERWLPDDLINCSQVSKFWNRCSVPILWERVRRGLIPSLCPGKDLKSRCIAKLNKLLHNIFNGRFIRRQLAPFTSAPGGVIHTQEGGLFAVTRARVLEVCDFATRRVVQRIDFQTVARCADVSHFSRVTITDTCFFLTGVKTDSSELRAVVYDRKANTAVSTSVPGLSQFALTHDKLMLMSCSVGDAPANTIALIFLDLLTLKMVNAKSLAIPFNPATLDITTRGQQVFISSLNQTEIFDCASLTSKGVVDRTKFSLAGNSIDWHETPESTPEDPEVEFTVQACDDAHAVPVKRLTFYYSGVGALGAQLTRFGTQILYNDQGKVLLIDADLAAHVIGDHEEEPEDGFTFGASQFHDGVLRVNVGYRNSASAPQIEFDFNDLVGFSPEVLASALAAPTAKKQRA